MSDTCDLAVIGGGPAGLACATEATRLGLKVVLFEALALGGELNTINSVDAPRVLPSGIGTGPDLAADLIEGALDVGVEVRYEEIESVTRGDAGWTLNNGSATVRHVVLATGSQPDLASVPGASGLHGRGVSTCSSCDGPLFKGKRVAVLGAGRDAAAAAMDVSLYAAEVTVIPRQELSVSDREQMASAVERDNVSVGVPGAVSLIEVPEGVRVDRPETAGSGEVFGGVFVTGVLPRVQLIEGRSSLERAGLVLVGDVKPGASRTVAEAIGDGVAAAWRVARSLEVPAAVV